VEGVEKTWLSKDIMRIPLQLAWVTLVLPVEVTCLPDHADSSVAPLSTPTAVE